MDQQRIGWPAIVLLYLATLGSMATVGIVVALTLDISAVLGVTKQDVGLALSIFSLPSALFAAFCGGLVDRVGSRLALILSCAIGAIASLVAIVGGSFEAIIISLALNGVAFTGVSVAAPAMVISASTGKRRIKAMSLWSTYPPTAFAIGLLIGVPFAGSAQWVPALAIHAGLMAALAIACLMLPTITPETQRGFTDQIRGFATVFREIGVLRLAVSVAVPSALSYGTSLISPSYLAEVHGVTMGASATVVAVIKGAAMILCGLATGALLARQINSLLLFAGLASLGFGAQFLIFWPDSGFHLAAVGLLAWLIAFGGMSASAMALLPAVIRSPAQSGAASGIIGQAISILSFMAPSVYFGMASWSGYVVLAGVGLLAAAIMLPAARPAPAEAASA